jgi:excisionase family DNA binding protein
LDILTRKDAAELLKMPLATINYLVVTGQIPYSRIGKRSIRFDKARIEEWFKERECVPYHRSGKPAKQRIPER